jgi:hypothetical protein
MNAQTAFALISPVLFGIIIVWLILIKILFNRLEKGHPAKYGAMGRPSLFLRSNIVAGWPTLKFLLAREHKHLNDSYLSKLADAMLILYIIYFLLFSVSSP